MAVTDQQKIDFLLKKIGFTKTKTGSVVGTGAISGTPKQPFAEAIPSPLIIANGALWNESDSIPTTPPGSDTAQVKVYLAGTSGLRMTADATSSGQRAYIAYTTYGNTSSTRLTNWIDTQFGSAYLIKVYKGDPNSGGVALSAAGSGANDGWFFDYSAGVLNFNDTNVPSGVTDNNIYIVGYRYIGSTGAPTPTGGGNFTFDDLNVSGDLDVDGHTNLDNVSISGVTTFSGRIVGSQTNNVIPFYYDNLGQLPSASTYHGAFAHVHSTGRAYFAHAGWKELVNREANGVVGTGTEAYNIGNINAVDGTFSGNVSIAGTLTYEDVKNVDAVGLITARSGIRVTGGVIEAQAGENKIPSLYSNLGALPNPGTYHGMFAHVHSTGRGYFSHAGGWYELVNKESNGVVGTGTEGYNIGFVDIGSNIQLGNAGIITATSFRGDGSQLSGISVDATSLKDPNGNVKIQAQASGAVHVGISTFQDIDVDGHTNLDNVSIAGVTTITSNVLYLKSASGSGPTISAITGSDVLNIASNGFIVKNQNGWKGLEFTGSSIELYSGQMASHKLVLQTNSSGVALPLDLDVDGHTNLDNVSVAGVTTFSGAVNINSSGFPLTVQASNSTIPAIRINNQSGTKRGEILANDHLNIRAFGNDIIFSPNAGGGTTGNNKFDTGNVEINNDLDVDGHTNLDNVSVAGVSTFSGIIDAVNTPASIRVAQDIQHKGDADTKISFPSADTITFDTAGTERLNIASNGKITVANELDITGNTTFNSTITAGGATGTNGQYLKSTGSGVAWDSFPTMRTTTTVTASAGQTTFSFTYNVGFLDVFINGTKLTDSEFTATNGSSVVLAVGCFVGDIVDLISYNTVSGGGGGGGGGSSITVQDEGSSLSTSASILNFVGTGVVASGTGSTKTITVNAGTADTTDVRTNTLEVVGVSTFKDTVSVQGANTRLYIGDANSQLYMSGSVLNVDAYARDIQLKTNAGGGDSKDIILHGGPIGELLRAHGTGDVDITNTLGIGGSITKASGQLDIRADNLQLKNAAGSATLASFTDGGAAELNYNNTKRLETLSNGVNVIGSLFVNGSAIGGGGGGSGFFSQTTAGIHTLSKVGIGTADPEFDLDLGSYTSQNVSTASTIRIMGDGASSDNTAIRFGAGGSNVDYTLLRIDGRDGTTDGDGNTDLGFALRYMSAGESGTDNRLAFWADNTTKTKYEALSIYNDGRVLVDNGAGGGHGFYGHPPDHFTVRGSSKLDNVRVVGVSTFQNVLPQTDSTYDIGSNSVRFANVYADNLYGDGTNITGISGGGADVGITTNLSGNFSATPGSPAAINTLSGYSSDDLVVEYTIYIKNGSNIQTQKLLAMRDGTTIDSTQFAVMFSSSLLVQCDAIISSGNIVLRATPESGITGTTNYKIKREVM